MTNKTSPATAYTASGVAIGGFAITPNSSADLESVARGVYVGVTGNLTVITYGESAEITFQNVQAGSIIPIMVRRVMATSTASGLIGMY
jgi:hypothetical protein